jgi:hypothetical protein
MTTHEEWLREQLAKGAELGEAQADREMFEAIGHMLGRDAETIEGGFRAFVRMAGMLGGALAPKPVDQSAFQIAAPPPVVGLVDRAAASADMQAALERQRKRDEAGQAFQVICALAAGSPETPAPELAQRARDIVHAFRDAFPHEPFGYGMC